MKVNNNNNINNNNNNIIKRKYNTENRKKLIEKINIIENKDNLIDIYNIIIEDIDTNYSINSNGIFININLLSDNCITNIYNYINDINITNNITNTTNNINSDNNNSVCYKLEDVDMIYNLGHKLSNYEKIIIKRSKIIN